MSKDDKKEVNLDILDEVKKIEKMVQVAALRKMLVDIKKKARQILELKEETTYVLDELGISTEDSKRIIDFVNSLGEVKLSEEDKKDLRQRVKKCKLQEVNNFLESGWKLGKKL